jgi:hypothetical protein
MVGIHQPSDPDRPSHPACVGRRNVPFDPERSRSMRACARFRFLALGLAALVALLALPSPAGAVPDQVVREDYSYAFDDTICGLDVHVEGAGTFRATIHEWVIGPNPDTADNWWLGTITDHGAQTLTNTDTGQSVVRTFRNNIQEQSTVELGDGFWQYTFAHAGPAVRLGKGKPIDVGRLIITQTIYFGDLSRTDDDVFYPPEATFDAGRHPVFYSDEPFCNALVAAIG